jgi:hypothetical protein
MIRKEKSMSTCYWMNATRGDMVRCTIISPSRPSQRSLRGSSVCVLRRHGCGRQNHVAHFR